MSQRDSSGGETKEENLSTPLTWGEFAVLRTLVEYSIPRALAFDRAFAGEPTLAGPQPTM